jgi:hypothetical protein
VSSGCDRSNRRDRMMCHYGGSRPASVPGTLGPTVRGGKGPATSRWHPMPHGQPVSYCFRLPYSALPADPPAPKLDSSFEADGNARRGDRHWRWS